MEPNKNPLGQPTEPVDPKTKQLGSIVAAHETGGPNPPAPGMPDLPVTSGMAGEGQQPEPPTLPLPSPTGAPTGQPASPPDPSPAPPTPSSGQPDSQPQNDSPPPPVSDQDKKDADLAQRSDVTMHPQDKTIKLPVPTTVLPALIIGILILILLLAVAALAFL